MLYCEVTVTLFCGEIHPGDFTRGFGGFVHLVCVEWGIGSDFWEGEVGVLGVNSNPTVKFSRLGCVIYYVHLPTDTHVRPQQA